MTYDVFKMSVNTPYTPTDILEFLSLTGLKQNDAEIWIERFSRYGITNLGDVNALAKMGCLMDLKIFDK